ncbi:hypothetical protein [Calothrix sp. UHCC 0171]|uniref:hypothetical protein n=1 Tax=Calothrix sp. UHCC 0171 TaxID=3110245 RepID=UPI002B21520D|nr:hypothetical protein [Calothrix sp. UHCC 0171]MEA5573404.1 hypothetical protein [Calothrix sp. UHCC 0171]
MTVKVNQLLYLFILDTYPVNFINHLGKIKLTRYLSRDGRRPRFNRRDRRITVGIYNKMRI